MSTAQQFVAIDEIVGMPGMPSTPAGVQAYIDRNNWWRADLVSGGALIRKRQGQGGGYEYAIQLLPESVRTALAVQAPTDAADRRTQLWGKYNASTAQAKALAQNRAEAMREVARLQREGATRTAARQQVAQTHGISTSSLARFAQSVQKVAIADYPAVLVGDYKSVGRKKDTIDAEVLEIAHTLYYRPEQPSFAQVYRELAVIAPTKGWSLPNERTLQRRVVSDSAKRDMHTLKRKGRKALEDTTPIQRRDVRHLHPMEIVDADYRRFDLFVEFEDGEICRPQVCCIHDIRSSMMLAARIEKTANSTGVRLAMLDVAMRFGIPSKLYIDNGREFASTALTAGSNNRNRWKISTRGEQDIEGLFPQLGMEVHFTKPYSGQSKPIERAFRDIASDVDKDPRLAGAYVGNAPQNKPDNYKGKTGAVPIALFEQVLADKLTDHNARQGRKGRDYKGRSFVEMFATGYETAMQAGKIQVASEAHLDMLRLESKPLRVKKAGEIRLLSTDYGNLELRPFAGQRVNARFDPDNLHLPISVYDERGRLICQAEPVGTVRFDDADAARETARMRKQIVRAAREQAEAESRIGISEAAKLLGNAYEARQETNKILPFVGRRPTPTLPAPMPTPLSEMAAGDTGDDGDEITPIDRLQRGLDRLNNHNQQQQGEI